MGRISEVCYEEIDPGICNIEDAGEFYYYYNLIGVSEIFQRAYEKYEENQLSIRNTILGNASQTGNIPGNLKVNTSIMGVSSLKNKVILVTEY